MGRAAFIGFPDSWDLFALKKFRFIHGFAFLLILPLKMGFGSDLERS